jgi:general secretion pathway protein K
MRQRGFALVIVLWSLVLLSLIVTQLMMGGRTETRIAANLAANAQAEAVADGAVMEAVFHLLDGPDRRWTADGAPHVLMQSRAQATVRAIPESGKINPNTASIELLTALLAACGAEANQASSIAAAILDWREPGNTPRPRGAKRQEYQAAGLDYAPPNAGFQSLDELQRVLGMTPDLFVRLKPHLSLFQSGEPNRSAADPLVAGILEKLSGNRAPQAAPSAQPVQTVSLIARSTTDNGGHFLRHALVQIGASIPGGYKVLVWDADALTGF